MKPIVLLDLDGVLADFEKGFLNEWRRLYPHRDYVPLEQRNTFKPYHQYPLEYKADVVAIYESEGFFANLEPIAGALQAVTQLNVICEQVYFCTSPLNQYRYCLAEKYDWIARYFGFEYTKRIYVCKDKSLVRGDYLIDDRPKLRCSLTPTWEHVLYGQPYNRSSLDQPISLRRLTWQNYDWFINEIISR